MEDLTIQYKYEMTGDGVRAVSAATGEVLKLATAEEKATQWAQALGQALADLEGVDLSGVGGGLPRAGGGGASAPVGGASGGASSDRLARAVEFLTGEVRRLPELMRSAAASGVGALQPPVKTTGPSPARTNPVGATPATPGARPDPNEPRPEADLARGGPPGGRVLGPAAGVAALTGLAASAARSDATPFVDPLDRQWNFARQFNIPGTSIGVTGVREILQGVQRDRAGVNVDEERRRMTEIMHLDDIVRRPLEAFKLDWGERVRGLNRQLESAYGVVPDPRSIPGPLAPPAHPGPAPGTRENPISGRTNEAEYRSRLTNYERQRAEFDEAQARRRALMATERFAPRLPLADLPALARGTLPEQQRFDEQMGRLTGRDRAVEARRTESAAQVVLKGIEDDFLGTAKRMAEAQARYAGLNARIETGDYPADGGITKAKLQAQRIDAAKDAVGAQQQLRELDDRKLRLSEEAARARGGVREADTQAKRIELAQAQQREATAASQAARLTELGPAGRAQALAVAEIETEAGYENLPAELRSMYQSAFPETARKKAEAAGQSFVGDFRAAAPDEFRDSVGPMREAVNQLMREIRKDEQTSPGLLIKDVIQALRDVTDRQKRLTDEQEALRRQVEAEMRLQNAEK